MPRVLYTDDDRAGLQLVQGLLLRLGWEVSCAPNGSEALDLLKKEEFDILVTDIVMPEMNGLELMRAVRQIKPHQPIIVVTGQGDSATILECLRQGVDDLIQKPLDMDNLERSMRRVLSYSEDKNSDVLLYPFLEKQDTFFKMTTLEAAQLKVKLPILEHLSRAGKLDHSSKLKIELAFQEAFTNALEHGNLGLESSDKEKMGTSGLDRFSELKRERLALASYAEKIIFVTTNFEQGKLKIVVQDQGKGFTPKKKNPSNHELPLVHGRGLSIMESWLDEVEYSDGGRQVTLVKILPITNGN